MVGIRKSLDDLEESGDIDRIADAVFTDAQGRIVDRDTFDLHFNSFIVDDGEPSDKQKSLGIRVFKNLRGKHEGISPSREFKKAKGKDLKKDQRTTAKVVVDDKKEFRKLTAQKVDLEGLDTKDGKITKRVTKKPVRKFDVVGTQKSDGVVRVVQARRVFVKFKGKRHLRFRDRKGRWVSRKK